MEPLHYVRDGFAITLWVYYQPAASPGLAPPEYAQALSRLHSGMQQIDLASPHFTDRVAEAHWLVGNPRKHQTRRLRPIALTETLDTLRGAVANRSPKEQLLHGEPHPGNLLRTEEGPLFRDFETCCRGPVEFDVAHAPEEVDEYYPDANRDLLRECRILVLAMVATWRWDRDDQLPNGRQLGIEWLGQSRAALALSGLG